MTASDFEVVTDSAEHAMLAEFRARRAGVTDAKEIGVDRVLIAPAILEGRLALGHKFNGCEFDAGSWAVGLGPVTDFELIAITDDAAMADFLVDALRAVFDQPAQLVPCAGRIG